MTQSYSQTVFATLDNAGIRYGVFKSSRALEEGLQGSQDLDILVHREDHGRFCAILHEAGAFRSVAHAMLYTQEREDWFVPLSGQAGYLHLDVHTRVLLGGKFAKRYGAFEYDDIQSWVRGEGSPPCVSEMDECRITLARIAFRQTGWPWQRNAYPTGDWRDEIRELAFSESGPGEVQILYPPRLGGVRLTLTRTRKGFAVGRSGLVELRQHILKANGARWPAGLVNHASSRWRGLRYKFARVIERLFPGSVVSRRHPVTGGLLVALVAPDGLGKSTQVRQLARIFGWKFCVSTEYLGTGDGGGWLLRRIVRTIYIRRKNSMSARATAETSSKRVKAGKSGKLKSFLRAAWGVMVALERLKKLQRASRARRRGFIVFCDRWPQSVTCGIMDGPVVHGATTRAPFVQALIAYEKRVYEAMQAYRPDVTIHMVADHSVSALRKPGEIEKPDFDARLDVMTQLRENDPQIICIDASQPLESVTHELFSVVWKKL